MQKFSLWAALEVALGVVIGLIVSELVKTKLMKKGSAE